MLQLISLLMTMRGQLYLHHSFPEQQWRPTPLRQATGRKRQETTLYICKLLHDDEHPSLRTQRGTRLKSSGNCVLLEVCHTFVSCTDFTRSERFCPNTRVGLLLPSSLLLLTGVWREEFSVGDEVFLGGSRRGERGSESVLSSFLPPIPCLTQAAEEEVIFIMLVSWFLLHW